MPRYALLALIPALALCAFAATSTQAAPVAIEPDAALATLIGDREVVFLAQGPEGGPGHALNPDRIDERHTPFSTFKIPNFLIALETGVIDDPDALREWDPAIRPAENFWPASWMQAQSLVSAFRRSAVWFFRDVAVQVGGERYREDLARFGYGNQAAADGNDAFWLDGSLKVSPLEQMRFIEGFLTHGFELADAHIEALRAASLLEERGPCRLHGKTGAGPVSADLDGPFEGWLVGWSECEAERPVAYALWVRGESFAAIRDFRQDAVTSLLEQIGALAPKE
jgi:beta-lactamase class D